MRRPRSAGSLVRGLILTGVAAIVLALTPMRADASAFSLRIDDLTDKIVVLFFEGNQQFDSFDVGGESLVYDQDINGDPGSGITRALTSDVDIRANIYEADGVTLSDTFKIFGEVGDSFFHLEFFSDVNQVPPTPLVNPTLVIVENGLFQFVGVITADVFQNGDRDGQDTIDFQFRSDVEAVPEPASMLLMGSGLAALAARRRRNRKTS